MSMMDVRARDWPKPLKRCVTRVQSAGGCIPRHPLRSYASLRASRLSSSHKSWSRVVDLYDRLNAASLAFNRSPSSRSLRAIAGLARTRVLTALRSRLLGVSDVTELWILSQDVIVANPLRSIDPPTNVMHTFSGLSLSSRIALHDLNAAHCWF